MPWTAAAIVGGAVIGGVASNSAAKKGAKASGDASALQYEQYQQTREDQTQARQAGSIALSQITRGLGGTSGGGGLSAPKTRDTFDPAAYLKANPDVAANSYFATNPYDHYLTYGQNEGRQFAFTPEAQAMMQEPAEGGTNTPLGDFNRDFTIDDFQKDPGYDFRLNQGLDSVQGSRAARGSMMSGATLKALQDYGSDYASSEYGKAYDRFNNDRTQRFNRLATVAGIGQTATNNVGTAGANYASGASNALIGGANASAAGTVGTANAINGGLSNLQSLYQLQNLNRQPISTTDPSSGYYAGGNSGGYQEQGGGYIP